MGLVSMASRHDLGWKHKRLGTAVIFPDPHPPVAKKRSLHALLNSMAKIGRGPIGPPSRGNFTATGYPNPGEALK